MRVPDVVLGVSVTAILWGLWRLRQLIVETASVVDRCRFIADSVAHFVWTADPDGLITYYNRRWYEFTGIDPEAGVDTGWQAVLHPDDVTDVVNHWSNSLVSGQPFDVESRFRDRATGEYRWFLSRARPMRDRNGHILFWVGTTTDIDQVHLARQDLSTVLEASRQVNRAKDHFIAVISHELRTPLTPIAAEVSAYLASGRLTDEMTAVMTTIRDSLIREGRLIDDLLDMVSIVTNRIRYIRDVVDMHEIIVQESIPATPRAVDKPLEVVLRLGAKRHYVLGDRRRLTQVVAKLIDNASKFTPDRGSLTVSTTESQGHLVIELTDTGVGIDPQDTDRIFGVFEQGEQGVSRRFGGLGLGLTTSRAIVESHGGRLTATSAGKGQGSTFHIEMEAIHMDATPLTSADTPINLRVLLVEDDQKTAETFTRIFTKFFGHTVVNAASLAEAREAADSHQCQFDLILSDIALPDGLGWELLTWIRQNAKERHWPHVPAIALSGYSTDDDVSRSMDAGFFVHLPKPIELSVLNRAIADAIRTVPQSDQKST
jgi:PAS domain S-box-containing protein